MKYLALVLAFATPAALAGTINMACPPGDRVVIHTVTNNGDFNHDGSTDIADLEVMKTYFGQTTNPANDSVLTDLNGDGVTNTVDLGLFKMLLANHF